jgi:hypothetical protein
MDAGRELIERLKRAVFGLCVEGETPTIVIALTAAERALIINALERQ